MHKNFRYIAKILLCSENFAMIAKFRYHCEIFAIIARNFAMPAKLPFFHCLLPASFSLHYASSSFLFLHPRLDEIDENSYELGINQHNFDANLDMMVKVYKTCKTTKNNLETKSEVLKGPTHVNQLKLYD